MRLQRLRRTFEFLTARVPQDAKVRALCNELPRSPARSPGGPLIAVQCVEDPLYLSVFAALCDHVRSSGGVQIDLIVTRSFVSGWVGRGALRRLLFAGLFGAAAARQWVRAFRAVGDRVAYRSLSFTRPIRDLLDWFRAGSLWRRLPAGAELAQLEVLGVQVGDLVIDSYLRFRPSPSVDVRDPFLRFLFWQTHRDIRRARAYFRTHKPEWYLATYSTYIDHGVPVRVALQEGVRVKSFGNLTDVGKELTLADWFHTASTGSYRSQFESLDRQEERLAQAEQGLRVRLTGGIDQATSYMKSSAYGATMQSLPDVKGAVVVFLHDFYDSPHVYDDLVFRDFWDWVCSTIEALSAAGQPFYVKPHPNQIALSSAVLDDLRRRYPDLQLLPSGVSNAQLAEGGMVCGVTAYGTVAHELAYLGVPTIGCARHPHHTFDFCRTARTREQYLEFLRTPAVLPAPREELRRQALAFYYMHNLYGDAQSLELRSRFVAFWGACARADVPESTLLQRFRELRDCRGLRALALQIAAKADGGSPPERLPTTTVSNAAA